jgi:hypothetical protein
MRYLKSEKNKGFVLMNVIIFGFISITVILGLTIWFSYSIKSARRLLESEQAFKIAEAGVEYYRWHLAHDSDDYQDGTGEAGPYVHDFLDKDGEKIGEFSLDITPPPVGSTLVTIQSTGTLVDSSASRTIETQLAIPSFARYAIVADSDIRFGEGTEVNGPIHSNGGIRFDGLAHNVVSSARESYDDPDHAGDDEFGVHTHVSPTDPTPPAEVPSRLDVFAAGREFPVPAVDFDGIISDLATIKSEAQSDGLYFAPSGLYGYLLVLQTDDTVDVYTVDTLEDVHWSCYNSQSQDNWGTWSVDDTTFVGSYDFTDNGLIFVEDDVWVEGQIDEARLTIAAATFPDTPANRKSITVNNNLLYTSYDGTDVIALIAQDDFNIGLVSEDDLQIDAAIIAQNGRAGRYYYNDTYWFWSGCSPYDDRDTVTLNGMIGSKERYGFAYTDGNGYDTRNINYDSNLLYAPPPNFPLTSEQYETISWEEIE